MPLTSVTDYLGRHWSPDFNCWDFIREIYEKEYGIQLAPHEIAVATAIKEADAAVNLETAKKDTWTTVDKPQAGDLALFGKRGCRFHVGFMATHAIVLHLNYGAPSSAIPIGRLSANFQTVTFYRHASFHNRS